MKTCPECGKEFKRLGMHMRAHRRKDDAMQERVQEAAEPEASPKRPLERFGGGRFVFGNGAGVMLRR